MKLLFTGNNHQQIKITSIKIIGILCKNIRNKYHNNLKKLSIVYEILNMFKEKGPV